LSLKVTIYHTIIRFIVGQKKAIREHPRTAIQINDGIH